VCFAHISELEREIAFEFQREGEKKETPFSSLYYILCVYASYEHVCMASDFPYEFIHGDFAKLGTQYVVSNFPCHFITFYFSSGSSFTLFVLVCVSVCAFCLNDNENKTNYLRISSLFWVYAFV